MKKIFLSIIVSFSILSSTFASTITAEMIYAKAYGALYKNNTKEAIRILEKSKNYYPDCAFLYAGLGDAYLKDKNYNKAIENYHLAQLKKNPIDSYKIDFYNANLQKNMHEISLALDELFKATKALDKPVLYKNINFILNERYKDTQIITELYLNTTDATLNQTNALKMSGKKEEAIKEYLKILNTNPQDFRAANNVGLTLLELKDFDLAEKYLLQGLSNNENSPIILNNLAVLNLYKKDYKKMNEYINEAIKAKNNYLPAINNKSVLKIHKELNFYQPKNAESILNIINKDFENQYATRTLAKIYTLKGDFQNATNILKALDSDYNFKLYTQKAFTSFKNDNLEDAINYINKAISLYSDNSIDYEIRGRIYAKQKEFDKAILDFQMAKEKNKNNVNADYHYAKTLNSYGRKVEAMAMLKEFVTTKNGNSNSNNLKLLFD